jgi:hypothetical protein
MTALMVVDDTTPATFSIEFIEGTHKLNLDSCGMTDMAKLSSWIETQEITRVVLKKGDVCVFNGRVIHRLTTSVPFPSSQTQQPQHIVCSIFSKNWYDKMASSVNL